MISDSCPDCGSNEWGSANPTDATSRIQTRVCSMCHHRRNVLIDKNGNVEGGGREIEVDTEKLGAVVPRDKCPECGSDNNLEGETRSEDLRIVSTEWTCKRGHAWAVERHAECDADTVEAIPGNPAQFAELAEPAPVHVAEMEWTQPAGGDGVSRYSNGYTVRVRVEGPEAAPLKLRVTELFEESLCGRRDVV